jgi:hypothetical protein
VHGCRPGEVKPNGSTFHWQGGRDHVKPSVPEPCRRYRRCRIVAALPVACGVQCDRNPLAGDNGRFIVDLPAQRPDRVAKIGVGREAARRELAKEIGLDVLAIDLVFACEVRHQMDFSGVPTRSSLACSTSTSPV